MDYFEKIERPLDTDLTWNIPDRKQGSVNIIGGNSQHFNTEIRISELMDKNYPIENLHTVLPDALETKLPPLPNFVFLESTDSGSFANADEILKTINSVDFNLLIGDLSKNSVTGKAISNACASSEKPLLITRDTIDLLAENINDRLFMNENLVFLASMSQLIKLFRAVYYPKVLLLSQSLIQVADAFHKFTLSYPVSIVTLHNEQILIAKNGVVKAIALSKSGYSPITIWNGDLATKILALNLYNPNSFIDATISAVMVDNNS